MSQLSEATNSLYNLDYTRSLDLCESLLDKVWEELNTGYWKDVHLCWRQAYSVVSVIKALSLSGLLSDTSRNIDHMTILRTCDMGLLMGSPVMNNVLARMSREFQQAFGVLGQWQRAGVNKDNGTELRVSSCAGHQNNGQDCSPVKKARLSQVEDGDKNSNVTKCSADDEMSPSGSQNLSSSEKLLHKRNQNVTNLEQTTAEGKTKDISLEQPSKKLQEESVPLPPRIKSQTVQKVPCCSCPSVQMFQAMFMDPLYPVVITDAIGYWPALTTRRWSLDYLRSVAGLRTVPVEIGTRYTEDSWTQKLMTINEMIDTYITNPQADMKAYLAQHQLFDQV